MEPGGADEFVPQDHDFDDRDEQNEKKYQEGLEAVRFAEEVAEESARLKEEKAEDAEEEEEKGVRPPRIHSRSGADEEEEESKRPRSSDETDEAATAPVSAAEEQRKKLFDLRMRLNQARKLNRQEVFEEDKRAHMPKISAQQQERMAWREAHEKQREEQIKSGEIDPTEPDRDYLHDTVLKSEFLQKKQHQKVKNEKSNFHSSLWLNPDATVRAYKRRLKDIPMTAAMYEQLKQTLPAEELYRTADSLSTGRVHVQPPAEFGERVVQRLKKDEENRANYHRRRPTLEDETVDYIHDGNKKFNKKLAKAFDRYTSDIKDNLERGTAL
ncbi:putative GCIP-interacting family protein [Paratrimastix pyriformis]|uniref:Pre-mRNA-splicing factor SYF2 n=1 Tax=Paratrimastix pyriformis TaxID=342808 RepID=A0ABQ8UQC1_9EUKA|nr:putative GCIP-interacting family protein [Paratrimastix pyriformis]